MKSDVMVLGLKLQNRQFGWSNLRFQKKVQFECEYLYLRVRLNLNVYISKSIKINVYECMNVNMFINTGAVTYNQVFQVLRDDLIRSCCTCFWRKPIPCVVVFVVSCLPVLR